jgi:hypothetical protein
MKENLWTFEEAYLYVKNKRPQIFPNFGFQKQLKRLEINLGLLTEEEYLKEIKYKSVLVK